MKIQKGQVQYKDRNDYYVTYGLTDDGKQYFFIDKDVEQLKNGNRIATTVLVEAIDEMVKPKNIGLINEAGEEVIPFNNRRIKPVNDDILLVEVAEPISQSVIDANNQRNEAQAATTLVSATNTVKEKISGKMGAEGRFVFNDLFSEATVYDINGNNLVNNEYFSFIGTDNNKLYMSKNTIDSEITEYSMLPPEIQSDVTPVSVTNDIDVSEASVDKAVVDEAMNNQVQEAAEQTPEAQAVEEQAEVEDTPPVVNEEVSAEGEAPQEVEVPQEEAEKPTEVDSNTVEVQPDGESEVPPIVEEQAEMPEAPQETIPEEQEVEAQEPQQETVASTEEVLPDTIEIPAEEVALETQATEIQEEKPETLNEEVLNETTPEVELNIDNDLEEEPFTSSEIQVDSIKEEDNYLDFEEEIEKDPDIADGTKILTGLIKQNKELKQEVKEQDEELKKKESTIRNIAEKAKMQEQKIEVLTDSRKRDRNHIARLESEKTELEDKVRYLERVNAAQTDELEILKPQLKGKEEMVRLYAEAEALLGDDDKYDYEEDSFMKKVA